ncbi:MAG: hypothetical protein F2585_11465, partial [Actinobacteria bacterium]|nr:hypothetical protein [Actinomycetota bacterium]
LVMLTSSTASANAALVVTTLADSGAGSLRQAILDANAAAGVDTITFTAGLTGTIDVLTDLPHLTGGIDLQGPGASVITIDGGWTEAGGESSGHALFVLDQLYIADGASTISGVTISGGNADTNPNQAGGAIQKYEGDGDLTIANVVLTGNYAPNDGGAVALYETAGNVRIVDSTLSNNRAYDDGGALYAWESGGILNLSIERVSMTGNVTESDSSHGGALYANIGTGTLTISDSVISGNYAGDEGGALLLYATTTNISNTSIDENVAAGGGGAILIGDQINNYGPHTLTISNSTLSGNSAAWGGAFYATEGSNFATVIQNSTISGNHASEDGGAIYIGPGNSLEIVQSTITDNSTDGLYENVGGIASGDNAPVTVTGVSRDRSRVADADETGKQGRSDRASVTAPTVAALTTITGSIVAGNSGNDIGTYGGSLPFVNVSHSVLGIIQTGVTLVDGGGTQVGVTDPMLGLLANNGGVTKTHALLEGSPAINAGPDPVPVFAGNEFDQRGFGFARIAFGIADAGAFEMQEPPEPIAPAFTG